MPYSVVPVTAAASPSPNVMPSADPEAAGMATAVAASLVDQNAATIAESHAEFVAVAALPAPGNAGDSDLESQDSEEAEDWQAQFAD